MRSVLLGDLLAAARVLIAVPEADRDATCREMLREAELADRMARRGNGLADGTLAGAAARYRAGGMVDLDNPGHCACLELLLWHLRTRPRSGFL